MEKPRILIIGSLPELAEPLAEHYEIVQAGLGDAAQILEQEWVHLCIIHAEQVEDDVDQIALSFLADNLGHPPKILALSKPFDRTSKAIHDALTTLKGFAPAVAVVAMTDATEATINTIESVLQRYARTNSQLKIQPEGVLGKLIPELTSGTNSNLARAELHDLFRSLFHESTSIDIKLISGLEDTKYQVITLWVDPTSLIVKKEYPLIVKIGPRKTIEHIRDRYEAYWFRLSRLRSAGYAQTKSFAAIAYPTPCDSPDVYKCDFALFYQMKASTPAIGKAIDCLFLQVGKSWYRRRESPEQGQNKDLRTYYTDRLGLQDEQSMTQILEQIIEVERQYGVQIKQLGDQLEIKISGAAERYPNPLFHLYGHSRTIQEFEAPPSQARISHCYLRGKNICVDSNNIIWLDGYDRLEWGPGVADAAGLEALLKFHCLKAPNAYRSDIQKFEQSILSATDLQSSQDETPLKLGTIKQVAKWIRYVRNKWAEGCTDITEYYANLFFFTIREMIADDISDAQRFHALISAAMICHRLSVWSQVGWPGTKQNDCDVFLSHNSKDKPLVKKLRDHLKERGLNAWLDEYDLMPGQPWPKELENIIRTARTSAILVGSNSLIGWMELEMGAILAENVKRKMPVIPVLLPGVPDKPELPGFLNQFTWVDLREGLDEDGLDRLEKAIRAGV